MKALFLVVIALVLAPLLVVLIMYDVKKALIGLVYGSILVCLPIGDAYSFIFACLHITTILLWVVKYPLKRNINLKNDVTTVSLYFLAICSFVVLVFSIASGQDVLKSVTKWYPFFLVTIAVPIGYGFSNRDKYHLVWALCIVGLSLTVLSYPIVLGLPSYIQYHGASASYIFLFGLPCALFLSLYSNQKLVKIISFSIYLIIFIRSIIQGSTQILALALLSTVLLITLYYYQGRTFGLLRGFTISSTAIGVLLVPLTMIENVRVAIAAELSMYKIASSITYRVEQYQYALNKLIESPLLGKGFGYDTTVVSYIDKYGAFTGTRVGITESLHTLYGGTAVYGGLFLLLTMILLILSSVYKSIYNIKYHDKYKSINYYDLGFVLAVSFMVLGVFSSKGNQLEVWVAFSIAIGLITNHSK